MKLVIDNKSFDLMFNSIKDDTKVVINNTIKSIGNNIVSLAQNTDKFKHGSSFNSGIKFVETGDFSGEVNSEVYNNKGVEYSNFLQYGNEPVSGKKMTFQIDGQWITTYNRAAIGQEHLNFFGEAVDNTIDHIEDIFNEELDKLK